MFVPVHVVSLFHLQWSTMDLVWFSSCLVDVPESSTARLAHPFHFHRMPREWFHSSVAPRSLPLDWPNAQKWWVAENRSNKTSLTVHLLGSAGRPWSGEMGICSSIADANGREFSTTCVGSWTGGVLSCWGFFPLTALITFDDLIEHAREQNLFSWL